MRFCVTAVEHVAVELMSLVPLVSSHPRLLSSCSASQALQTLNGIEAAGTPLSQLCDLLADSRSRPPPVLGQKPATRAESGR